MRPSRNRRPSSMRFWIPRDGLRRLSLSSARMARDVGPTHAAAPGTQGHPGNSCSADRDIAQKPLAQPVVEGGLLAGGSQQPVDGARMRGGPSCSGGSRATRAVTQVALVDAGSAGASLRPAVAADRIHRCPLRAAPVSPAASSASDGVDRRLGPGASPSRPWQATRVWRATRVRRAVGPSAILILLAQEPGHRIGRDAGLGIPGRHESIGRHENVGDRKVGAGGRSRHYVMSRASLRPAGIIAPAGFCGGATAA